MVTESISDCPVNTVLTIWMLWVLELVVELTTKYSVTDRMIKDKLRKTIFPLVPK